MVSRFAFTASSVCLTACSALSFASRMRARLYTVAKMVMHTDTAASVASTMDVTVSAYRLTEKRCFFFM